MHNNVQLWLAISVQLKKNRPTFKVCMRFRPHTSSCWELIIQLHILIIITHELIPLQSTFNTISVHIHGLRLTAWSGIRSVSSSGHVQSLPLHVVSLFFNPVHLKSPHEMHLPFFMLFVKKWRRSGEGNLRDQQLILKESFLYCCRHEAFCVLCSAQFSRRISGCVISPSLMRSCIQSYWAGRVPAKKRG